MSIIKTREHRVLLLEDEPGDAHLMKLTLKRSTYQVEVRHASDGAAALHQLRTPGEPLPDLILVDLKMPGMGGLEFLAALKQDESLRGIPAVVISTSSLVADVENAYRAGAAGYLLKNVDINEFGRQMEQLCNYWLSLITLPGDVT